MCYRKCRLLRQLFAVWFFYVALSFSAVAGLQKVKYIFLMIGDGLGATQRNVAEVYKRHSLNVGPGNPAGKLVMNTFPVSGMTTTHSVGNVTTDSAAAATALSCGEKTLKGVVAMTSDKTRKLKAITYDALEKGMKVGIVSSISLDHATPACFYASETCRAKYYQIAMQIAPSNFNYFAGHHLYGARKVGKRLNPLIAAKNAGYKVVSDKAGFNALKAGEDKVIATVTMDYKIDQNDNSFTLAELVDKGITLLDNPKGFFMMVEGGLIDKSGHANDIATNIKEVLDFDEAIDIAYKFYEKHPDETLIVVTGDHETGGLKTSQTGSFQPAKLVNAVNKQKVSGGRFCLQANKWNEKKIDQKKALLDLIDAFGLNDLSKRENQDLASAVDFVVANNPNDKRSVKYKKMYGNRNVAVITAQSIIARRCGVFWTTFGHTGVAVKTTAIGVNAGEFAGNTDNTDIAKKLRTIILQSNQN